MDHSPTTATTTATATTSGESKNKMPMTSVVKDCSTNSLTSTTATTTVTAKIKNSNNNSPNNNNNNNNKFNTNNNNVSGKLNSNNSNNNNNNNNNNNTSTTTTESTSSSTSSSTSQQQQVSTSAKTSSSHNAKSQINSNKSTSAPTSTVQTQFKQSQQKGGNGHSGNGTLISKLESKLEIGKSVIINQIDGTTLQGFIHAYDKLSTLVCLEMIPSSEIALISTHNIKHIQPNNASFNNNKRTWSTTPVVVDLGRVKAEEDRLFRKRHLQYLEVGLGVTSSMHMIFDTLAKTLPCKWDDDTIVILDTVRLKPPYNIKSISGDGDTGVVRRVKMILENESSSIKSNVDTNGVKPT